MDVEQLRNLFLFEGLDDGQLGQILAAGEEVPFEEGTVLFVEGDPADRWWVLLSGRVDLVRRAGRRDAVVMMTMERPGVWAGGFQAWNPAEQLPRHRPRRQRREHAAPAVLGARRAGALVVPLQRPPHRRLLPDRPQHGHAVAPSASR